MSEKIENIVTNDSNGHGYKYASLSDIAKQGFTIPKMKVETDPVTMNEYVYYFDKELNEWVRGARVVIPEGTKMMNAAQLYGSALTYARRYTVFLADSLASDDDQMIEELNPEEKKATEKQIEMIVRLYDSDNIAKMLKYFQVGRLEDLTVSQASQAIDRKKTA